jgi:glycosyltransferase involved in cell wall biosynthesis
VSSRLDAICRRRRRRRRQRGYGSAFAAVEAIPDVVVFRRPANGGKGAALKDGYRAAFERWPDAIGVVTADADGQHDPDDVTQVARTLIEHPDHLVLGVRRLDGAVPWRSRAGNHTARALVQLSLAGVLPIRRPDYAAGPISGLWQPPAHQQRLD